MRLYETLLRPWLFELEAETAHNAAVNALALAGRLPLLKKILSRSFTYKDPALETQVAGIRFPNPVGLAAGFDKDCRLAGVLPALGFGFVELGTVTARPQPGNPRPRIFRAPEQQALINRLGFNNGGSDAAALRLSRLGERPVPVGINIGINADVKPEEAPKAYSQAFRALHLYADYFTVNVSSPNTEGLRRLQEKNRLERILLELYDVNADRKPVFVKLSPDLEDGELRDLLPMIELRAAGVVCCNTTISRAGLPEEMATLRGGLSGAPLRDYSTRMIREVYKITGGRLPIIGVGGIFSAEDAYQKLRAGASLVQAYTGFVYKGPSLASQLNRGLVRLLAEHGLSSVPEAVGKSHPEIARVIPRRPKAGESPASG